MCLLLIQEYFPPYRCIFLCLFLLTFSTFHTRRACKSHGARVPRFSNVPFYSFRPLFSYWSMFARRSVWAWFPWRTRFSPSSALPRRPLLPFGPGRQSVWSLAKNWFCSRLSSFLISLCNSADVRFESCCETFRAERFRRLGLAFSPSENQRLANEVMWLTIHQHYRHQNLSPSYKHHFDQERNS